MNETNIPETRRVGVWAEGAQIEAKEFVIPKRSPESSDDIPTIPDLDDLQDILDKEMIISPSSNRKDIETANTLAEVGGGISGNVEGIDAALEVLMLYVPEVEADVADTVWTVDSLLTQLANDVESTP